MECSEPGLIRDEELLAYLAGEKVRPLVGQHLARCQRCSAQLAAFQRIELSLTSKLYRWDCPPNHVLGEYQLGLLSKELSAAVRNHLGMCTLCAAELATLTEFLANDPVLEERSSPARTPQLSPTNNNHRAQQGVKGVLDILREQSQAGARRIIATLIPPQPRLAFQRDLTQTTLWPRRYRAEDVSISIQVERDSSQQDRLQLIGFATRQGKDLASLQGTSIVLSIADAQGTQPGVEQLQSIDELGNFVFSALAPATYDLEMHMPESGSTIIIDHVPVTLQD